MFTMPGSRKKSRKYVCGWFIRFPMRKNITSTLSYLCAFIYKPCVVLGLAWVRLTQIRGIYPCEIKRTNFLGGTGANNLATKWNAFDLSGYFWAFSGIHRIKKIFGHTSLELPNFITKMYIQVTRPIFQATLFVWYYGEQFRCAMKKLWKLLRNQGFYTPVCDQRPDVIFNVVSRDLNTSYHLFTNSILFSSLLRSIFVYEYEVQWVYFLYPQAIY